MTTVNNYTSVIFTTYVYLRISAGPEGGTDCSNRDICKKCRFMIDIQTNENKIKISAVE